VKEPLYIILLGPPGSGKGTQAQALTGCLGLKQVASGDLFREHLNKKTVLGETAKIYLDRGELAPDDLTIQMVMERLAQPDCQAGAVLDGFPRTVTQARFFDEALKAQHKSINLVISISVPDEIIVERLSGRWICPIDNRVYHTLFNPPSVPGICDVDGAKLYQRSDDQPETVRKRLKVYAEKTKPLIDYYAAKNLLVNIDGYQPIELVTDLLVNALKARPRLKTAYKSCQLS